MIRRRSSLKRRTRMPRISPRRATERAAYRRDVKAFLVAHPFCQAQTYVWELEGNTQPLTFVMGSNQVHHRNKCRGARLLDQRWWMAVGPYYHEEIETRKEWARKVGLLLPLEADVDGRLPDGTQCLTTDELLKSVEKTPF